MTRASAREGVEIRLSALHIAIFLAALVMAAPAAAATVAEQRAAVVALEEELAALDARAGQAAVEANAAIDALDETRAELAAARSGIAEARRGASFAANALSQRLVELYVAPPPSEIELLLTGARLSDIGELQVILEQTARTDAGLLTAARERRAELEALRAELEAAEAAEERRVAEKQRLRQQVEAAAAARRERLASAGAELRRLIAAREKARRVAAARLRAQARVRTTGSATAAAPGTIPDGDYVFPMAGPTNFTDDWLYARPGGRYHQGIDLFAARGTPIVAIADGTLSRVGWNTLGGWRLWLRDTNGTDYYYAHFDRFAPAAREGAQVSRGTVIGYNGDSGSARGTPPHLHLEIHPGGGGPVRPWPYVTSWPRPG